MLLGGRVLKDVEMSRGNMHIMRAGATDNMRPWMFFTLLRDSDLQGHCHTNLYLVYLYSHFFLSNQQKVNDDFDRDACPSQTLY